MRRFRSPSILLSKMMVAMVLGWTGSAFASSPSLRDAVEAAWGRQPESSAHTARQEEMAAKRDAASALFPAPPSIALAQRTDRFNQNRGDRETEAELTAPVWMPGTRDSAQRLAAAETAFLDTSTLSARLRLAGEVRDTYWQARLAQNDRAVSVRKADEAALLMQDVERRLKAGEAARVDANQAQGAERLARASLADAEARAFRTLKAFTALTGLAQLPESGDRLPEERASGDHPQLSALEANLQVQRAKLAQASAERREPPEVSVGMRRERPTFGEAYENSVRLAVRIPLAAQSRNAPRITAANAELIEAETALARERERIQAEVDTAKAELMHAQQIEKLAEERYQLASDTKALYAKAFRLGELDLPTRLRSENEFFDAELSLSRARLETGRAISRINQALGLLP
ncbi:MAG TPA: TolC family protein [Noviherbaspirillum sp.]|nr:TolC family protein [Noviherbaspirillum sp.]